MSVPESEMPAALAEEFPAAEMAQWRQLIDKALKGADFDRRLVARTADDIRIEPLFAQRPAGTCLLSLPRRAEPAGWDIRQLHAGNDPAHVNTAVLEDLAGGATSVTLQIASPGWSGLPCDQTALGCALADVLLDVCPVALRAGERTPEAAVALMDVWDNRGIVNQQRRGAFNYDPLGTLAETGSLAWTLPRAMLASGRMVAQTQAWPHVSALRADGHVWHATGASEAQELAAVLGAVVAYLRAAEGAGVTPQLALPKIAINLAVDADQLMGLAKLRAARRLLARIAEACGAPDASSKVALTAETSRAMMTERDPWVNMLRTTMACATAAWGGADCITVLPFTWPLGQPDAFARRMARNTSVVLMEESGLGRVADPAAGSFAIETLTADLENAAWQLFVAMEADGGLGAVLSSGKLQDQIASTASHKRAAIASGKIQLTGTSAFPRLGSDGVTVTPWPAPPKSGSVAGGVQVRPLAPFRPSEPFEKLRRLADNFTLSTGQAPQVFLACLGPLASHAARATWISNFLAAGGIESIQSAPLLQSPEAGRAFAESGATVACLCAADDVYAELAEATTSLLKTAGARYVLVAGRPKGQEAALKGAGVDQFIYSGCDMVETLQSLLGVLGAARSDG